MFCILLSFTIVYADKSLNTYEFDCSNDGFFFCDTFSDSSINSSLWEGSPGSYTETNGYLQTPAGGTATTDELKTVPALFDNGYPNMTFEIKLNVGNQWYAYISTNGNFADGDKKNMAANSGGTAFFFIDNSTSADSGFNYTILMRKTDNLNIKAVIYKEGVFLANVTDSYASLSNPMDWFFFTFNSGGPTSTYLYYTIAWEGDFDDAPYLPDSAIAVFESPTPPDNNINNTFTDVIINASCSSGTLNMFWNGSLINSYPSSIGNYELNSSLVPSDGEYTYSANCDGDANVSRTWTYDTTQPFITINGNNLFSSDNSSVIDVAFPNKIINVTLSDNNDLFAFSINITDSTGNNVYSIGNSSLSGTSFTITDAVNISTWGINKFTTEIVASDSHTMQRIDPYTVKKKPSKLEFDTAEGNNLKIISADASVVNAVKSKDRYSFDFDFINKVVKDRVFTVQCDGKLYRKHTQYSGHLICSKDGVTGNWIDFEGLGKKPIMTKVSDNEYRVLFKNMPSSARFNSVGGLNVNTETFSFNISTDYPYNPNLYVGNRLIWEVNGSYTKSQEVSLNISLINSLLSDGCTCGGCVLSGTDCSIPFDFYADSTAVMEIELLNASYAYGVDNCTEFSYPFYNLTYRDQSTSSILTIDKLAYDLDISYPFTQTLQGTFTNTSHDGFCTNINLSERGFNYTISGSFTLTNELYATKTYNYPSGSPLYIGAPPLDESLYMILLNESSTVFFNWLTTEYQSIDGIMQVYQCDGAGNRILIDQPAIIDGEATSNMELLNVLYSYEVIIDGVTYTDPDGYTQCHLESETERTYYVDLGTGDISDFVGLYSIVCNVTSPSALTARMSWSNNPLSTSTITACILGYRTDFNGQTLVYENCTTTGNSMTVAIPDNGLNYYITGKLYQNGYSIDCSQPLDFSSDNTTAEGFGITGVFAIILIIISLVLLYGDNGWKQDFAAGLGLLLAWILGITNFNWVHISAMLFFLATIVWIGRTVTKNE